MPDHDHSYKLLFSHPQMVRDLLTGFIREDWLEQLDYDSLERVNGSYVSGDLRERTDDVVWRVRWGESWVYLYLLLEFQSTVEPYMAVRILGYVALLYQDLIRTERLSKDGSLPPALPIVLYNGARPWQAPVQVEALIQAGPKALEPYRPRLRYVLIDEGQYQSHELASLRNLVAALLRLERSQSPAEIQEILAALVEWLKSPEQQGLRRAFAIWVGRVILAKLSRGSGTPAATTMDDLEEMRTMLADRIEEWAEEFKQEGQQAGETRLLERLLRKRFGELPEWVSSRLRDAQPEQLERWGERLLEVDSLNTLFEQV